jgi:hypothetical protein
MVIDNLLDITQNLSIPPLGDVGLVVDRLAIWLKDCCGM